MDMCVSHLSDPMMLGVASSKTAHILSLSPLSEEYTVGTYLQHRVLLD